MISWYNGEDKRLTDNLVKDYFLGSLRVDECCVGRIDDGLLRVTCL